MGLLILNKWTKLVPMSPGWLATDILNYVAGKETYVKALLSPVGTYQPESLDTLRELIKQLKSIGEEMAATGHYVGYRRFVGTGQHVGTVVTAMRWSSEQDYNTFLTTNPQWPAFESLRNDWLSTVKVMRHSKRWESADDLAVFRGWATQSGNVMIDVFDKTNEPDMIEDSFPPL